MASAPSIPFFGRRKELNDLRQRVAQPGLTVVRGRPQIGKTRLLTEFVRQMRTENDRHVGMAEATGTQGDALLRAIADAYAHWLRRAGMLDQLRSLHKQYKGGYTVRVGTAIGKLLSGTASTVSSSVAAVFSKVFSGLRKASDDLRSGGVHFERLQADEARDLLEIIAHKQNHPVVLVVNQWEEGLGLNHDVAILTKFLRNLEDWPSSHVVLHLRDPREQTNQDPDPAQALDKLTSLRGAPIADWLEVLPIPFDKDLDACDALNTWLRDEFPATQQMDESERLDLIAGNPAVLQRWWDLREARRSADPDLLRACAQQAHAFQYPEFETIFTDLLADPDGRHGLLYAAIRLALIPTFASLDAWESVTTAVLDGAPPNALTELRSRRFLGPSGSIPAFIHPTAQEAARRLVLGESGHTFGALAQDLRPHAREAMEQMVFACVNRFTAKQWGTLAREVWVPVVFLASLQPMLRSLEVQRPALSLSLAATAYLPVEYFDQVALVELMSRSAATPAEATLLAHAQSNAIADSGSDFPRTDGLLGELRTLAREHPQDAAVRAPLTIGLFNAIYHSGSDFPRADRLLGELRTLATEHPHEAAVREQLANGLTNAIAHSGSDFPRADRLLGELRTLAKEHPQEEAVREPLANGLFNAFNNSEPNSTRADGLLGELRTLASEHPQEAAVRERFASGLNNAIVHSGSDSPRADRLLGELRTLATEHPREAAVHGSLLRALGARMSNALNDAQSFAALLREAADLVPAVPNDVQTQEIALAILDLAQRADAQADGADQVTIDTAGRAFWRAYRAHWPERT